MVLSEFEQLFVVIDQSGLDDLQHLGSSSRYRVELSTWPFGGRIGVGGDITETPLAA